MRYNKIQIGIMSCKSEIKNRNCNFFMGVKNASILIVVSVILVFFFKYGSAQESLERQMKYLDESLKINIKKALLFDTFQYGIGV